MIFKKIIIVLIFTTFLNGCIQNTALLGPFYTFGTTGSALQTGLSYGTNKTVQKIQEIKKDKELKEKNNSNLSEFLEARIAETRKKLKNIK